MLITRYQYKFRYVVRSNRGIFIVYSLKECSDNIILFLCVTNILDADVMIKTDIHKAVFITKNIGTTITGS